MEENPEEIRQQFRLYLEKSGVIDALSRALVKLYEEVNKPDDAVSYLRKYMCDECPLDEDYETLKADHLETLRLVAHLEEEISRFKSNIKLSDEELQETINEGFKNLIADENCESLLKKYLTKKLLNELKELKTSYNATIFDCIQSGLENHDYKIGVYAADPDCYCVYHNLFNPIICDYFNVKDPIKSELQKPSDWGDPININDLDPEEKYIISITINVSRNLDGFPFVHVQSEIDFDNIAKKMKNIILSLENYKGTFLTLKEINPEIYSQMIHKQITFGKNDQILESGGCYRFWPVGRAVFYTLDENLIVWINAEDHIKIISKGKNGNLKEIYQNLVSFVKSLNDVEGSLHFTWNDRYGYLTFSPENLGTTLHVSTRIKLPNLMGNVSKLNELLDKFNLKMMERNPLKNYAPKDVCEITHKPELGPTEFERVKAFEEGIIELLKVEESLS